MPRKLLQRLLSWVDAAMATSAVSFIAFWTRVERSYRRPSSRLSLLLRFSFYPLLALGAVGWLAWDWSHDRALDSAEDAIFDRVIDWRPVEPKPSGRTVIVEIDDCSIDYYVSRGEGGWPWSRQRHADVLDKLDRAGVRSVGYDVMFIDPSTQDPIGDATLESMAEGGQGRFMFASSRRHADFDRDAKLRAAAAPGAFPLRADARRPGPQVALVLPYGEAMTRYSGLSNVTRNEDGVLRDIHLRERMGDWALPSLPLRVAAHATRRAAASFPASVRVNWRTQTQLPYVSAVDLIEGRRICGAAGKRLPVLKNRVVLVGYTAAGVNDAKPTPVNPAMPGVEVLAEATEALVADSAIWMPPSWVKYVLAAVLVLLTAFAFWRGEPATDVDSVFVATNVALLLLAFSGLTFFGVFFDIFSSVGFVSLCFGLCRLYAGIQRGRAVGNGDYLDEFDPERDRWLVVGRLRFVPNAALDRRAAARRRREYRRRLRRFLYAGSDAVMLEGVVERKSWLHDTLDDLMVLVWKGGDQATARELARRDLDALHVHLNAHDDRLDDDGVVRVAVVAAEIDDGLDTSDRGERLRLREVLGRALNTPQEWPLSACNTFIQGSPPSPGANPCPSS